MNLEEFIKSQIETVNDLRALLEFHAHPKAEWDSMGMAVKLYLRPAEASVVLNRLTAKGLLSANGEPASYRFQPRSDELSDLVRQLAELDRKQPVTLINMIYGRPKDLQAFADAFKIKKEKGN